MSACQRVANPAGRTDYKSMFRDRAHFNSFISPWDKDGNSVRKGEHLKVLAAAPGT
jgi:hypothetical protein